MVGDVARLKEAVGEYKENTSRLECQKQLLLKQVTQANRFFVPIGPVLVIAVPNFVAPVSVFCTNSFRIGLLLNLEAPVMITERCSRLLNAFCTVPPRTCKGK